MTYKKIAFSQNEETYYDLKNMGSKGDMCVLKSSSKIIHFDATLLYLLVLQVTYFKT